VRVDPRPGYIGSAPGLKAPFTALSLHGLRRKLEALMLADEPHVLLILDGATERERHRRRAAPPPAQAR
jgi:hypothetical protein